jgi:hypothetical protein
MHKYPLSLAVHSEVRATDSTADLHTLSFIYKARYISHFKGDKGYIQWKLFRILCRAQRAIYEKIRLKFNCIDHLSLMYSPYESTKQER